MSSLTKSSSTSSGRIGVPRKDWLNTTDTDMDMFGEVLNDRLSAWPLLLGFWAPWPSAAAKTADPETWLLYHCPTHPSHKEEVSGLYH